MMDQIAVRKDPMMKVSRSMRKYPTVITAFAVAVLFSAIDVRADVPLPKSETVRFDTDDGVTIVGTYYPPTGRAIAPPAILLHMYRNKRRSYEPLVMPLHEAGFAVLAIDLRGHGESIEPASMGLVAKVTSRDEGLFANMYKDVEAAVKWVNEQPNVDNKRLALVGASVGCSVAFDYASRHDVTAMVCLSPDKSYLGLDSEAHLKKIDKTPMLLLATEPEAERCKEVAAINKNATAQIIGGQTKAHGTRMFGRVKDAEKTITEFLSKHTMEN